MGAIKNPYYIRSWGFEISTKIPSNMRQYTTDYTGVQTLKCEEASVPEPGEGEVLVKVNAISVNFRDVEGRGHVGKLFTKTYVLTLLD